MKLGEEKATIGSQQGVVDPKDSNVDELGAGIDLPDIEYGEEDTNIDLDTYQDSYEYDVEPANNETSDDDDYSEGYDEEPDSDISEEEQEITSKNKQTPEENSAFARIRRKEEELAKREAAIREAEIQRQVENDMLSPEKIWDYADENGISEEMARKFLQQEAVLKSQQMKLEAEARQTRVLHQKEALQKDPLYHHFESEIDEILRNNPDVDANVAFDYVVGKNRPRLTEILSQKAEKKTLANVQDRMKRRGIGSSDAGNSSNYVSLLTKDDVELCNAFGTNPKKIALYVKNEMKRR